MVDDGHTRNAQDSAADEHGSNDVHNVQGGHEHREYWPPRSVARARASEAIDDLIANGHDRSSAARTAVARLKTTLGDLRELDEVIGLFRMTMLGDEAALADARRWLDFPHHTLGRTDTEPRPGAEPSRRGDLLSAESWVNPSAMLDLAIGAVFVGADTDRPRILASLEHRITDTIRPLAVVMTILAELPAGVVGRDRFDAFLDQLGDFDRFRDVRLDLGGCLAEMIHVLSHPGGALTSASRTARLEIDDNTERIDLVTPNPICTGDRLVLTSKAGQPFVQKSGVTVAFWPCARFGTDIEWTPDRVSITVPAGARSGPVYFLVPDMAAATELATTAATELVAVLSNCSFLAAGAATSMMVGALRTPLDNARCILPIGVGVALSVTPSPDIVLFRAVAADGSPLGDQTLPGPDDPVRLEWEVNDEGGVVTDVRLHVGTVTLIQNGTLRGTLTLAAARATATYALEVTSSCGTIRRNLLLAVVRVLNFDPPELTVGPGQTATLNLMVDRASPVDMTIYLATTPGHPTAAGWMTMPAGQTRVPVSYPALQHGPPAAPALTIVAYAPRHRPATGRVWVDAPLGTHEVVADRTAAPGQVPIDVVGVHAALMLDGSVLLFAYDESPSAYADVNRGKSAVWNPSTGEVRNIPMSRNLFCAGHAFLGDGRLLVAGGQSSAITVGGWIGSHFGFGRGADHDVHVFSASGWTRLLPEMPGARWYPTCTTMPDGRVMIISGYAAHAYNSFNTDYEIVDPATSSLVKRTSFTALLPYNREFALYPFAQVLPGRAIFVHSHDTTWLLPLDASSEPIIGSLGYTPFYNAVSTNSRTYPGQGGCILLPLDPYAPTKASVLIVGGGGGPDGKIHPTTTASDTAEIFDYDSDVALDAQVQWRFTRDAAGNQTFLTNPRLMADAVLLPDSTVAVIGGAGAGEADNAGPAIMWIESFDPATETFAERSGITVPRLYHSTSLLLPDGSVMIAGSTGTRWSQAISGGSDNEFRIEIYRPPYLFRGPRPVFELPGASPASLTYGQTVSLNVPTGARKIKKAAMIRHGSTTHTNNMDQRYVGLKITARMETQLTVELPPDGAVAPPGPYLLFVIGDNANSDPVPSKGTSVLLGP